MTVRELISAFGGKADIAQTSENDSKPT